MYVGYMNILIVDDSEMCRKTMKQLFMKNTFFHKLFFAKNGFEAIQQIQQHADEIDCVLMDNEMPIVNGIEAVQQLREDNFTKPIVGITSSQGFVLDEFKQCGVDGVFSKPFDKNTLDRLIEFLQKKNRK